MVTLSEGKSTSCKLALVGKLEILRKEYPKISTTPEVEELLFIAIFFYIG